jgi:hypothetical protein
MSVSGGRASPMVTPTPVAANSHTPSTTGRR